MIDRGGLTHVNNMMYNAFLSMELVLLKNLTEQPLNFRKVAEIIKNDDDVQFIPLFLSLHIYAFHCCLSLLIEIVVCKFLCTCTTTLMLIVNNVMPPKKMQYEIIIISTYNQCDMRYIALK